MPTSDTILLASFERKLQLIRDRVQGVAYHYYTACYLVGRPGTSKTFTVKQELEKLGIPFVIRNARMSAMGLFDFLNEHPEHVIVLDDISTAPKADRHVVVSLAASPLITKGLTMLSIHEAATMRAALRFWAEEIAVHDQSLAGPYLDDRSEVPLGVGEIKELIKRLDRENLRYVLVAQGSDKVFSSRLLIEEELPGTSPHMQPLTVILPCDATSPSSIG